MEKSFLELMKDLETAVSNLEKEDLDLEGALEEFKKGINIFKECQKRLKEVEEKTKVLIEENEELLVKGLEE